jgi:hypothetical protein|tara:strand:- start:286 stop:936 length:651 start_codon:yes stop_codon:yes gene_type:complete
MSVIFEKGDIRVLFIHIPKTGGTSVRNLMISEGWTALPNPDIPVTALASKELNGPRNSNHQHEKLRREWVKTWDYEFTFVRNPYDRILSRAKQQARDLEIDEIKEINFFAWVDDILLRVLKEEGPGAEDNHHRPQHHFISEDTAVFRIEDQKEDFLKALRDRKIIGKSALLGSFNQSLPDYKQIKKPNWKQQGLIHKDFLDIYREDFVKFGYEIIK